MFEKRMQTANIASSIMKIRKHTIVSKLKRTYKVASSTNGTKNYDVAICNIPSCTCADFKKNGKVVFCKHIVFLVTHVLSGSELMEALSNRYITDMELTQLFQKSGKDVLPKYLQEKSHCRKKKNFMSILREHEDYSHEQAWLFHKKESRSAQCTSVRCKKLIQRETECFSVDGALTIPYNSNKAVKQKFYFCAEVNCLLNRPPWTNIEYSTSFSSKGICEERRQEMDDSLNNGQD